MKIIIIGGGASGMAAALYAAKSGHEVTILEAGERIGKKLLSTGNGRCNFTNPDQSLLHYHGLQDEEYSRTFVRNVFSFFSQKELLTFLQEIGIESKERNGCIYPLSEQASAVLDCFRFALKDAKVSIITSCPVTEIAKEGEQLRVVSSKNQYLADRVILSAGSKAGIGANMPDGYSLVKKLGHTLIGPVPGLVALKSDEKMFKPLAGIRVNGQISLLDAKGLVLAEDRGEIQLTGLGPSGIPAMQVSYIASKHLAKGETIEASLDFLPDVNHDECLHMLITRGKQNAYRSAQDFLIGLLHKNLGVQLMKMAAIPLQKDVCKFSQKDYETLGGIIKGMRVPVLGTMGFAKAQICAGGVALDEVKDTLESKCLDHLYLTGEILDVHGDCGGYNLQWAFTSGMLAGVNCTK